MTLVALGARKRGTDALLELARELAKAGHKPVVDPTTCQYIGDKALRSESISVREPGKGAKPGLAVALGGDGSFIQHALRYAPRGVPLVGVNLGAVGFLADVPANSMVEDILALLNGVHEDESRIMLEVDHWRDGKKLSSQLVINDLVIDRGASGALIGLFLLVDNRQANSIHLRGDGVIVSTPGGSTAYNMSAGGPIITPDSQCVAVTPLNPYSLTHRPLVFGSDNSFTVHLRHNKARLLPDGNHAANLKPGDAVKLRTHRRMMTVRHPRGYDYFATLRDKLYWRHV